jgi:pimeloyl-ACP methyl ester carboxylesterase
MRLRPLRLLPIAYGWLMKHPIEHEISDSYVSPVLSDCDVRRDLIKVLKGVSPQYTLAAAHKLGAFTRPVLITWAPEGRFFPFEYARKLAAAFPDARLKPIEDSYTFVPEDQPQRLAQLITAFVRESTGSVRRFLGIL